MVWANHQHRAKPARAKAGVEARAEAMAEARAEAVGAESLSGRKRRGSPEFSRLREAKESREQPRGGTGRCGGTLFGIDTA